MVSEIDCICNKFEKISAFYSIWDFEHFQKYINELVNEGYLEEIPVQSKYADFTEQWYRCKKCKKIWRLVHPDFPFKGLWDAI